MFARMLAPWGLLLTWSNSVARFWFGPTTVHIRRAVADDAARLAELHARSFAHPWSRATFEQLLTDRAIDAFVAEIAGATQGFIVIRRVADEAELLSVGVEPGCRRCGAGRRLTEAGIATIMRERISMLFLEVEAGNAAALALYRTLGFVEIGRRKGYYRSVGGAKDALTMRLDLNGRPMPPAVLDG